MIGTGVDGGAGLGGESGETSGFGSSGGGISGGGVPGGDGWKGDGDAGGVGCNGDGDAGGGDAGGEHCGQAMHHVMETHLNAHGCELPAHQSPQ